MHIPCTSFSHCWVQPLSFLSFFFGIKKFKSVDIVAKKPFNENSYFFHCVVSSFSCICPVIDNEFLHNIVKIVYGQDGYRLVEATVTLTTLWTNSCSITVQTHKKWRQFVKQNLYLQSKSSHNSLLDVITRRTCVTSIRDGFGFYVSFWVQMAQLASEYYLDV